MSNLQGIRNDHPESTKLLDRMNEIRPFSTHLNKFNYEVDAPEDRKAEYASLQIAFMAALNPLPLAQRQLLEYYQLKLGYANLKKKAAALG